MSSVVGAQSIQTAVHLLLWTQLGTSLPKVIVMLLGTEIILFISVLLEEACMRPTEQWEYPLNSFYRASEALQWFFVQIPASGPSTGGSAAAGGAAAARRPAEAPHLSHPWPGGAANHALHHAGHIHNRSAHSCLPAPTPATAESRHSVAMNSCITPWYKYWCTRQIPPCTALYPLRA